MQLTLYRTEQNAYLILWATCFGVREAERRASGAADVGLLPGGAGLGSTDSMPTDVERCANPGILSFLTSYACNYVTRIITSHGPPDFPNYLDLKQATDLHGKCAGTITYCSLFEKTYFHMKRFAHTKLNLTQM